MNGHAILGIILFGTMMVLAATVGISADKIVRAIEAASERSCDCRCDGADLERTSAALRHTAEGRALERIFRE